MFSRESVNLAMNMGKVERHPLRAIHAINLARGAVARMAYQKRSEPSSFLAILLRARPASIIEIGLARGGMLWALCQCATEEAQIVSVDLPAAFHGLEEEELISIEAIATYARPRQHLTFIQRDSHSPEAVAEVRETLKGPADLLFIDGDHRLESVTADLQLYRPLIRPGGMVAFHDILPHDKMPGVAVHKLWNTLEGKKIEITSAAELNADFGGRWGGIGVLRV